VIGRYPKRLIEIDLPIRAISEHARREKSTSTITGLHLWWARRPLAACRAVICATLWPDPADPECPTSFHGEAVEALLQFSDRARQDRHVAELCGKSWPTWMSLTPTDIDSTGQGRMRLRQLLLLFIAQFANPRATTESVFVETARRITLAAHRALSGAASQHPLVFDPFAGGGSIPLEALRVGAGVLAADINPVSLLINEVLIRLAPRVAAEVRDAVLSTAEKIIRHLEPSLSGFYPEHEGRIPIAYIWARTILSEAPEARDLPVEVPLIRSMWLSRSLGSPTALRWARDSRGTVVCDRVDGGLMDGTYRMILRPRLEIFRPSSATEVEAGTASGGAATCPVSGYTTPRSRVRSQLGPRRGGTQDARLIAVVTRPREGSGRMFHLPSAADADGITRAARRFETLRDRVGEPLPGGRVWRNNPFRVHNYGMMTWGDLFTKRQHVALSLLAERVASLAVTSVTDPLLSTVQAVLALSVARLADHLNSGCAWNPTGEKLQHLFARQAVPVVWDFCEANPLGGSVGDWLSIVRGATDALRFVPSAEASGDVFQASAAESPLPDASVDALVTDPPYYDAVPYADLSEFFYVWLRRCAPLSSRQWFSLPGVDRAPEIVFDENRQKDNVFYVRSMTRALREARRVTKPSGIGVVVFAHKSTTGWEALLKAVLDAGWVITASWPIDTELATRVRAMDSAVLASSVHLVCRPRENPGSVGRTDEVGDWRDVLQELPRRIHEWMPRLAEEGVVGADAIFACLGPALEIFSRYSRVEKASGEVAPLKEYLEQVWAAVAKEALTMVFAGADATGFEADARLTAMWLWTLNAGATDTANGEDSEEEEADDESEGGAKRAKPGGFALEYDAARKIAQGLGAHLEDLGSLVEVAGETARLLPVAERTRYLFGKESGPSAEGGRARKRKPRQGSLFEELEASETGARVAGGDVQGPRAGSTVLDRVHQSMILFAAGRGEALKRFLVEDGVGKDGRFWRLADALAALYPRGSDERRWVEGVLARKKGLGF